MNAFSHFKMSTLEDISIFTQGEDMPLAEVFQKIFDAEKGKKAINPKGSGAELTEYLNKVYDWGYLCKNPNAMHIILNNWDKVEWITFSRNPSAIHIIVQLLQEQKDYNIRKIKNLP
jgi:hypothetical protein